ncbi:uncharacterized protein ARMOST_14175 [Armillaria ostoyae]|uniref:Uncharacterized protein n=1 Tax=Armillaria ostoyae TaxID=47428 RepID=A0A284RPU2_ARMOS|nr:uncharacterized protein ARMOST_14175 [Armillaria ostoyae]
MTRVAPQRCRARRGVDGAGGDGDSVVSDLGAVVVQTSGRRVAEVALVLVQAMHGRRRDGVTTYGEESIGGPSAQRIRVPPPKEWGIHESGGHNYWSIRDAFDSSIDGRNGVIVAVVVHRQGPALYPALVLDISRLPAITLQLLLRWILSPG